MIKNNGLKDLGSITINFLSGMLEFNQDQEITRLFQMYILENKTRQECLIYIV